jgi:uncharacterized hydrophobic protein (TIGR00271 family)
MSETKLQGFQQIKLALREAFNLKNDKAEDSVIDTQIRDGVDMQGTNLWVLIFAIFIASIGLNVNSTAVIIGAMLISPLMGPIIGIGYGAGIYDFWLIKRGLKNLAIALLISLLTSTLYFLISPLTNAQSELLARTSPTLWDLLIAVFGGLAGIIGVTRHEKSNIIPGVAIATALMPPLCTAGYEIANGNWVLAAGALYLFTINSVFIALSAMFVIRYFHVEQKHYVDLATTQRVKRYTFIIALLTTLPSLYLAYALVQEEVFKAKANKFIEQEINTKSIYVAQTHIKAKQKNIDITIMGEYLNPDRIEALNNKLNLSLHGAHLQIHQASGQGIDINALKSGLLSDLTSKSSQSMNAKDQLIQSLQALVSAQQKTQQDHAKLKANMLQTQKELLILFPNIQDIWISQGTGWDQEAGAITDPTIILNLRSKRVISTKELKKINDWFAARMQGHTVKVLQDRS